MIDFFVSGFCESLPSMISDFHCSQPFDEGYLHRVYSLNITPTLRDIADYRYLTSFKLGVQQKLVPRLGQLGFSNKDFIHAFLDVEDNITFEESMKYYFMLESSFASNDQDKIVANLKLSGVVSLLFLCFSLMSALFVILLIERTIQVAHILKN